MKKITRYYCGNGEGMFESKAGAYVEYKEHNRIVKELEALQQKLDIPAIVSKRPSRRFIREWLDKLAAKNNYDGWSDAIDNSISPLDDTAAAFDTLLQELAACDSEKGGEKSGCGWVCYDSMECAQFGCQKPED